MKRRFELFRMSLIPKDQQNLFEQNQTREEFIREIFSKEFKFNGSTIEYHFVPEPENIVDHIIGRLGRAVLTKENRPPEDGLQDYLHEGWKAAVIAIDPTHHDDGQKISIEFDKQVGTPAAIVKRLVEFVNDTYHSSQYHLEVEPIFDASSFWDFSERNKGKITSLTFEFVAPNMFGATDDISNEMRDFRDTEKAQRVSIKLSNSDGLDTDTDKIHSSVEYTTKGGGSIRAKAKDKKTSWLCS